jgi:hypothetical protein
MRTVAAADALDTETRKLAAELLVTYAHHAPGSTRCRVCWQHGVGGVMLSCTLVCVATEFRVPWSAQAWHASRPSSSALRCCCHCTSWRSVTTTLRGLLRSTTPCAFGDVVQALSCNVVHAYQCRRVGVLCLSVCVRGVVVVVVVVQG